MRSRSVQGNVGSSAKLTLAFFVIPKHACSLAFSEKYVFAPIDRHGGDHIQVTLNESLLSKSKTVCGEDLMALDEAIEKLESIDTTKANLVKLRFFGG